MTTDQPVTVDDLVALDVITQGTYAPFIDPSKVVRAINDAHAAGLAQGRAEGLDVGLEGAARTVVERYFNAEDSSDDNEVYVALTELRSYWTWYGGHITGTARRAAIAETPVEPWTDALADPAFVAALDQGLEDVAAGRVTPLAETPVEAGLPPELEIIR